MNRSSNVKPIADAEPKAPASDAAERSSNVQARSRHAQPGRNAVERSSNATARIDTAELITLTLSDGPAREQVRAANVYEIGEPIALACQADAHIAGEVTCAVVTPDKQTIKPTVTQRGSVYTAHFRSTVPGDYWYAFVARNEADEILVRAERHFVVRKSRVPD